MAIAHRCPDPGLIVHSDRGTQYTSTEFTGLIAEHQMTQSLSRPRQCWDNAVAESFFVSLKLELIDRHTWATRTQVRRAVFDYVEVFFNRRRLHSSLDYLTPAEYEARIHHHKAAHAATSGCPANRVNPSCDPAPSRWWICGPAWKPLS